jgi:hypothetical protein
MIDYKKSCFSLAVSRFDLSNLLGKYEKLMILRKGEMLNS